MTQPGTLVPPVQGTSSHFPLSSLQVVSIVQHLLEGELEASGTPAPGSLAWLSFQGLFVPYELYTLNVRLIVIATPCQDFFTFVSTLFLIYSTNCGVVEYCGPLPTQTICQKDLVAIWQYLLVMHLSRTPDLKIHCF